MSKPITSYGEACGYLDDLQMHKIKLGLDAVRTTLADLGSPEKRCPVVHVAGTNGKGSVCSLLHSMLTAAGYKTGLYTSPHLSSVRERFRIGTRYIDEAAFTRLLERIRSSLGPKKITYFECATALAFCWFAENNCDLVVLETGMGGRLDATNVVIPLVSVITTISLDHEQYLGDTVAAIAFEKAGIIKAGVPVVSGVRDDEARSIIEATCRRLKAPLCTAAVDFRMLPDAAGGHFWRSITDDVEITDIRPGKHRVWLDANISCAVAAAVMLRKADFKMPDSAVRHGVADAFWPGRMEYLETAIAAAGRLGITNYPPAKLRFLLDGAHNAAGIAYLLDTLKRQFSYRRLLVVWASMADKRYHRTLKDMAAAADIIFLTQPESERSATPEDLARALAGACREGVRCCPTIENALLQVSGQALPDDLIVVAGSLYLVGAFRKLLVGEVVS